MFWVFSCCGQKAHLDTVCVCVRVCACMCKTVLLRPFWEERCVRAWRLAVSPNYIQLLGTVCVCVCLFVCLGTQPQCCRTKLRNLSLFILSRCCFLITHAHLCLVPPLHYTRCMSNKPLSILMPHPVKHTHKLAHSRHTWLPSLHLKFLPVFQFLCSDVTPGKL